MPTSISGYIFVVLNISLNNSTVREIGRYSDLDIALSKRDAFIATASSGEEYVIDIIKQGE